MDPQASFWQLEMDFTLCSSAENSLRSASFKRGLAGRCRWSLWTVVPIDFMANASMDPTGDDARVRSCVLSFVDSTAQRIQLRVVNVFDVEEPTKEQKPRFDNAVADSDLEVEESDQGSRGHTSHRSPPDVQVSLHPRWAKATDLGPSQRSKTITCRDLAETGAY